MTLAEKHKIKAEEKKLEKEEARAAFRLNQIKPTTNACFNILFVLLSFVCLFPVFYVFMISVSSTDSITKYGYRLFPDTYSTAAYTFLWNERGTIFNSLIISVVVTVMGTVLGVLLTTMIGYVLSRPNYKLKGFFTWMVFIPMIFNGGMVANYVVVANMLRLNNTIPKSSGMSPTCRTSHGRRTVPCAPHCTSNAITATPPWCRISISMQSSAGLSLLQPWTGTNTRAC